MNSDAVGIEGIAMQDAPEASQAVIVAVGGQTPSGRASRSPVTKFKPQTIKRILGLVEKGVPLSFAAPAAGVSYRSFCFWRQTRPAFAEQVEAAIAKGIEKRLTKIESASESGDWRASAWLLEHCQPEHFAKSRIQAEVVGQVQVEVVKPEFDFVAYEKLCKAHFAATSTVENLCE